MDNANADNKNFVKATKEGRLYIPTSDFFKQQKVKDLLEKLLDSPLYKEIKKSQKEQNCQTI